MKRHPWWLWLLVVDLVLIAVTTILPYLPTHADIPLYRPFYRRIDELTLANEMNVAAWWAGINLVLASAISYELYSTVKKNGDRFAWLVVAFVLGAFSLDEMASMHERLLGDWLAVILVAFFGLLLIAPAFWVLLRNAKTRKSALFILSGLALMGSAAPQEFLEHNLSWPASLLGLRVGIEEGTEVLGTLFCLVGLVRQRPRVEWPNEISRVVPNPLLFRAPRILLFGAACLHVSLVLFSTTIDANRFAHPAVYVPTILLVITGSAVFWRAIELKIKWRWTYLPLVLVITSVVTFYLLPAASSHASRILLLLYAAVCFIMLVSDTYRGSGRIVMFATVIILIAASTIVVDAMIYTYIAAGIGVVLIATVELSGSVTRMDTAGCH